MTTVDPMSLPPERDLGDVLADVLHNMEETRDSIDALASQIAQMVPREEADRAVGRQVNQRRWSLIYLAAALLAMVFVSDVHTETCGPGAATERVVEALAQGRVRSISKFQAVAHDGQPDVFCEVVFPIHSHDPDRPIPTKWNFVGWVLYVSVFGTAIYWARRPVRGSFAPLEADDVD